MRFLAIDTSCDETSAAVTDDARVLSNVISSQVRYHKKFGGVVPFLAQRLHTERIDAVVELALQRAKLTMVDIDAIAVTFGPGLAPALQVGIEKAKKLAATCSLPLYAVNHMAGHIAACYGEKPPTFPSLAILVSGGHSELVYLQSYSDCQIVGQTLDDALGEAYDKVAKMLGLGYPGGKLLAQLAQKGDSTRFALPIAMIHSGDLNLSYSGLKNAVRILIEKKGVERLTQQDIIDICACFEKAAQESLLRKIEKAMSLYPEINELVLGGGVAANTRLRGALRQLARIRGISLRMPASNRLCTDNAAMIGLAAWFGIQEGLRPANLEKIDRVPYTSLEELIDFR